MKAKEEQLNPILLKLNHLLDNGISREKVCAASDIRFNTLKQCFHRNRVSERVRLKLLRANIISEEEHNDYERWFREQNKSKLTKRGKRA